jgi:hypothetical protein
MISTPHWHPRDFSIAGRYALWDARFGLSLCHTAPRTCDGKAVAMTAVKPEQYLAENPDVKCSNNFALHTHTLSLSRTHSLSALSFSHTHTHTWDTHSLTQTLTACDARLRGLRVIERFVYTCRVCRTRSGVIKSPCFTLLCSSLIITRSMSTYTSPSTLPLYATLPPPSPTVPSSMSRLKGIQLCVVLLCVATLAVLSKSRPPNNKTNTPVCFVSQTRHHWGPMAQSITRWSVKPPHPLVFGHLAIYDHLLWLDFNSSPSSTEWYHRLTFSIFTFLWPVPMGIFI